MEQACFQPSPRSICGDDTVALLRFTHTVLYPEDLLSPLGPLKSLADSRSFSNPDTQGHFG